MSLYNLGLQNTASQKRFPIIGASSPAPGLLSIAIVALGVVAVAKLFKSTAQPGKW